MNTWNLALLSALALASIPSAFANAPATEEALARSTLVGMQLSVRKSAAQGKLPNTMVACVEDLPADSLVPVFRSLLEQNLTADELVTAEKFFQSEVGQKFAKSGIAHVYVAFGEQPPEPVSDVSESEYKELEQFSQTGAGQKLWSQKVIESPAARNAVTAKIGELLDSCRPK